VNVESVTHSRLEDDLLEVLRAATATPTLAYDGPPARLTGGFWAELVAFRLEGAPPGWDGELVARVMPDPVTAAKETAIQAEVAAQGFPTPAVRLAGGPGDGLGRAFMVMDLVDGGPLLGGLGGAGAIAALPKLARRLPDALGETMASLHRLDPSPVRNRLMETGGSGVGIDTVLTHLETGAAACERADLVAAARWLRDHPPADVPEVVCHGDLHPFNLLVTDDGDVTVLDWSASVIAPAAYDVAFTSLVLAEPPVTVPRPLRPAVRAAGRWLSKRFRRAYADHAATDVADDAVQWHVGLVCLRALVEVAGWVTAGTAEGREGHPWMLAGPAFAGRLHDLIGSPIRAR
jgi:aminoglycoside phosphotransferase (APT) family kinase protein